MVALKRRKTGIYKWLAVFFRDGRSLKDFAEVKYEAKDLGSMLKCRGNQYKNKEPTIIEIGSEQNPRVLIKINTNSFFFYIYLRKMHNVLFFPATF